MLHEYEMEVAARELENNGFKFHHSATRWGYHSVKGITVKPYKGRFGEGYTIECNDCRSTRYHSMFYFIKEENK